MERTNEDEMHRIADAYRDGSAALESDPAYGTWLVEGALMDAYGLGVADARSGIDIVPERFMAFWELWETWSLGHMAAQFDAIDGGCLGKFVPRSRDSLPLRRALVAERIAMCEWPVQSVGLDLARPWAGWNTDCM